ncbi:2-deoxy-5-keto-D-gluconate 6-phosphate aldolase domain-containing protein, partial [Rhizobium leguminosarum]|uniref:2-deoxy-5-keto-D-gluconate 6-phosphate aldolase domain-containing protein n=1 Tax=Rhizobium leguminosarum TaxID=384 RepID=UPI003F958057
RRGEIPLLMALAIYHRSQLVSVADELGVCHEKIVAFKRLAVAAAARVSNGRDVYGMLIDERFGRDAFFDAATKNLSWLNS